MYFVLHWFNLADEAREDALLDSSALRRFVGIDLGRERVPDATTPLKFRRLLEAQKLGEGLFAKVGEVLHTRGLKVEAGTPIEGTAGQGLHQPAGAQRRRDRRRERAKNRNKSKVRTGGTRLRRGQTAMGI